jgi:hypothetical protein
MWTRIFILCGSGFLFETDADPGYQNNADPDPQNCSKQTKLFKLTRCRSGVLSILLMTQERKTLKEERQVVVSPMLVSRRCEGCMSDFMREDVGLSLLPAAVQTCCREEVKH